MARMVATKAALSIRLDALADADSKSSLDSATIGLESRVKLESRLRLLEQGIGHTSLRSIAAAAGGAAGNQKKFELQGNGATYNDAADTLVPTAQVAAVSAEDAEAERKRAKKEKKEKKAKAAEVEVEAEVADVSMAVEGDDVSCSFDLHDRVHQLTRVVLPFSRRLPRRSVKRLKRRPRLWPLLLPWSQKS